MEPAIDQCPNEVLSLIFHKTLPPIENNIFASKKRWHQASSLCLVSRRWRDIAIDTPFLWQVITITFVRSPETIIAHWARAVRRVKAVPATVIFEMMGDYRSCPYELRSQFEDPEFQKKHLNICNLQDIPRIHTLRLHVSTYLSPINVIGIVDRLPIHTLEHLEIEGRKPEREEGDGRSGGWNTLLSRFPPFKSIKLVDVGYTTLSPSTIFDTLTEMEICDVWKGGVSTTSLLKSCPNLRRLHMTAYEHGSREKGGPDLKHLSMPHLTELAIDILDDFPWHALPKFPFLGSFQYRGNSAEEENEAMQFISAHPSITKLDIHIYELDLPRIHAVAPQLTTLLISERHRVIEELTDLEAMRIHGPLLPQLQVLTLRTRLHKDFEDPLPVEPFEALVRQRCLPGSHPDRIPEVNVSPLQTLIIITAQESWLDSHYISQATLLRNEANRHGQPVKTMSWL